MNRPFAIDRGALRRLAQAGTVVLALAILYATLAPNADRPRWLPDGAAHALLFMSLGVPSALWYATSDGVRRSPRRLLAMAILALWLFGGLTEVAQGQVGRDPALSDWFFDVVGAVAGFVGGGLLWRSVLGGLAR
ncbi:MAG: hypothetical protein EXR64_05280 [Dehalococcoidia bacterium]|nr:hypothetical protein [Dehalococcoidia bacterium]